MQTILLIENTLDGLSNLTVYLKTEGYKVLTADNGKKGIEMAEEYMPDLIICSVSLPGVDGYKVLHALRESPKASSIPFIFSTSQSERMDLSEVYKLGADNYLVKPYAPETLLDTIRTQIKRARSLTLHL
jgi:DNA-binding response OmpR family regulator